MVLAVNSGEFTTSTEGILNGIDNRQNEQMLLYVITTR